MKTYPRFITLTLSLVMVVLSGLTSGCKTGGTDPQPTPTESEKIVTILSASTWKIQGVTVDGADQTGMFKGLTLNFTGTSFTTANGSAVWPVSGTWKFSDGTTQTIDRGDGIKVTLLEVTETKLSLGLAWSKTTFGPGRIGSVKGQHVFVFGK